MTGSYTLTAGDVAVLNRRLPLFVLTTATIVAAALILVAMFIADDDISTMNLTYAIGYFCLGGASALIVMAFITPWLSALFAAVFACYPLIVEPSSRLLSSVAVGVVVLALALAAAADLPRRHLLRRWSAGTRVVPTVSDAARREIGRYQRKPFLIACLLLLGAVVATGWCVRDVHVTQDFRRQASTTQAKVDSVNSDATFARVTIDGRRYDVPLPESVPDAGEVITVRYDPDGQRSEWADDPFDPYMVLSWTGVGVVLGAAFAAQAIRRRRHASELLRTGAVPVQAMVSASEGEIWVCAVDDPACTVGRSFEWYLDGDDDEMDDDPLQDPATASDDEILAEARRMLADFDDPSTDLGDDLPRWEKPLQVLGLDDPRSVIVVESFAEDDEPAHFDEPPRFGVRLPEDGLWEAGRLSGQRSSKRVPYAKYSPQRRSSAPARLPQGQGEYLASSETTSREGGPGNGELENNDTTATGVRWPILVGRAAAMTRWWLPWLLVPGLFYASRWLAEDGGDVRIIMLGAFLAFALHTWVNLPTPTLAIRDDALVYHGRFLTRTIPWAHVIGVVGDETTLAVRVQNADDPSGQDLVAVRTGTGKPILKGSPGAGEARTLIEEARSQNPGTGRASVRPMIAANLIAVLGVAAVVLGYFAGTGGALIW